MPRKQKQRQSQKQTVIVNIREPSKKKRSVRRRKSASRDGVSSMQTALPPPVIYQSTYSIPYPVQAPPPIQAPVKERGFLTDVGQVGTEGRVEILDRPTRQEQQSEMITPVPSQIAGFADLEGLRKRVQTAFVQTQTDRTSTAESGMQTDRMQLPPRPKGLPPVNYVAKMVSDIAQKEAEYKQKITGVPIEKGIEEIPPTILPQKPLDETQGAITKQLENIPEQPPKPKKKRGEEPEPVAMQPNPMAAYYKEQKIRPVTQKQIERAVSRAASRKAPRTETQARAETAPRPRAETSARVRASSPRPTEKKPRGTYKTGWQYYLPEYKKLTGTDYVKSRGEDWQSLKSKVEALKFEMTTTKA